MNSETLIDVEFSGRLCLTLFHSVWQVALAAAAAWSVDRIWGRRSVQRSYALYVTMLIVSLAAMPITYGLVGVAAPPSVAQSERAVETGTLVPSPVAIASDEPSSTVGQIERTAGTGGQPTAHDTVASLPVTAVAKEPSTLWLGVAPWIVGLYAVGVFFMFARLIARIWHAERLGSGAQLITEGVLVEALNTLARNWSMRVAPALARAEQIAVPKVVGLARPTILLPASAITGLSPDQLEMILAHELAHVRRYDMWVNLLQHLAEATLFFNPALWYLSRRISVLREYCCDELTCRATSKSDVEPRTRYATALLRIAELSTRTLTDQTGSRAFEGSDVAALAASGRSPSELRRRVAHLFGEPLREPLRISRSGMLTLAGFVLLMLLGPPLWPSGEPTVKPVDASVTANQGVENGDEDKEQDQDDSFGGNADAKLAVVVARHVLLLDGKEIITWAELEEKIATMPDPTLASPSFYITRGAHEAGIYKSAKEKIWRLHRDYKLRRHSEGSLWPRSDLRYDRIQRPSDLVPDESLRIDGRVVNQDGEPVGQAEVILIASVDQSIPYRSYHAALVRGRVRNRLNHVMTDTDEQGRFSLYPPKNVNHYIVALHPDAGFAFRRSGQLVSSDDLKLMPWSSLVSEVAEEPGLEQRASLYTRVAQSEGWPEVLFNQHWVGLKIEEPTRVFAFTHVPPIFETTIERSFPVEQGVSLNLPGASVSLLPGETRSLGLGPLSEQQRKQLERRRRDVLKRIEAAEERDEEADDASDDSETSAAAPTPSHEDNAEEEADSADAPTASDNGITDGKAEEEDEYTAPITVFGRALDVQGKPIAGAEIFLASRDPGHKRLAQTKSAADGSYRFEEVSLPIKRPDTYSQRNRGSFEVFGIAEAHALTWRPKKYFYPEQKHPLDTPGNPIGDQPSGYGTEDPVELDLTFGPPKTIRGRVVDERGQPIPDTTLAIRSCRMQWDREDDQPRLADGYLESLNSRDIVPPRVKIRTTGADGRFEFTGLPAGYLWGLDVRPPGHPSRRIYAATREAVDSDANGNRVYSGDFEVVFAPPRKLKLRVVYDDTGEPAPQVGVGGKVTVAGFFETTDEDGFVEVLLPDGRYRLGIVPRYGSPYLRTESDVVVSAETAQQTTTLRLRPAGVIDVTVVDADTGKPLVGVDVWLWLDREVPGGTESYARVHGYRSWEVETRISHYESPRSDANGKMRVLFEPGKHRIGVALEAYPEGYEPVERDGKEVHCRPGEPISVEFRMRRKTAANRIGVSSLDVSRPQ